MRKQCFKAEDMTYDVKFNAVFLMSQLKIGSQPLGLSLKSQIQYQKYQLTTPRCLRKQTEWQKPKKLETKL